MHRACSLLRTNNRKPLLRDASRPCAGSMLPLPRLPATRGQSGHIATILASLRFVDHRADCRHPRVPLECLCPSGCALCPRLSALLAAARRGGAPTKFTFP